MNPEIKIEKKENSQLNPSFVINHRIQSNLKIINNRKNEFSKNYKTSLSMMAKKVVFGEESRKALVRGINAVADAVKPFVTTDICENILLHGVTTTS